MRSIPSLFIREHTDSGYRATPELTPGTEWVVTDGNARPTEKVDGTPVLMGPDGVFYFRRCLRPDARVPEDWRPWWELERCPRERHTDIPTKLAGWVPATPRHPYWAPLVSATENRRHDRGSTYELVGPKINGNPYRLTRHQLDLHGARRLHLDFPPESLTPTHERIQVFLESHPGMEGVIWHHPDGWMVKVKRRDFGLPWPTPEAART